MLDLILHQGIQHFCDIIYFLTLSRNMTKCVQKIWFMVFNTTFNNMSIERHATQWPTEKGHTMVYKTL